MVLGCGTEEPPSICARVHAALNPGGNGHGGRTGSATSRGTSAANRTIECAHATQRTCPDATTDTASSSESSSCMTCKSE
eukprot:3940416-Prymnesium_polylepis.1